MHAKSTGGFRLTMDSTAIAQSELWSLSYSSDQSSDRAISESKRKNHHHHHHHLFSHMLNEEIEKSLHFLADLRSQSKFRTQRWSQRKTKTKSETSASARRTSGKRVGGGTYNYVQHPHCPFQEQHLRR